MGQFRQALTPRSPGFHASSQQSTFHQNYSLSSFLGISLPGGSLPTFEFQLLGLFLSVSPADTHGRSFPRAASCRGRPPLGTACSHAPLGLVSAVIFCVSPSQHFLWLLFSLLSGFPVNRLSLLTLVFKTAFVLMGTVCRASSWFSAVLGLTRSLRPLLSDTVCRLRLEVESCAARVLASGPHVVWTPPWPRLRPGCVSLLRAFPGG